MQSEFNSHATSSSIFMETHPREKRALFYISPEDMLEHLIMCETIVLFKLVKTKGSLSEASLRFMIRFH